MKLYIVVHENASGPKDSVDTKPVSYTHLDVYKRQALL